jgi:hypothetical protein
MRTNKIALSALLLCITAVVVSAFTALKKPANKPPEKGFALIELFTSEGCSSCPPADALVARIQKEDKDKPVYILAYHVDYWNNLGWKDQFSNAAYSQRQRQYASWLKLSEVYTPQIVVNGKKEFVGSDEHTLRSVIQTDLQKDASGELTLNNARIEHDQLSVQYQSNGSKNQVLLIAFVQKAATTQVKNGENGGRTLAHINIVKSLNSISLHQQNGDATVKLPAGFNEQTWDIVGFVQNITTGEVLSAQKITLPHVS